MNDLVFFAVSFSAAAAALAVLAYGLLADAGIVNRDPPWAALRLRPVLALGLVLVAFASFALSQQTPQPAFAADPKTPTLKATATSTPKPSNPTATPESATATPSPTST